MFVPITNTPRPYAWGSRTAIAEALGREASGEPEAELWLGAHAGSPSRIVEPATVGGASTVAEWIAGDAATALGELAASARLPFLLKLLAADHPLSLQAHPTPEQARAGFVRENEAGVALDAADRNYKDEYPKPELIFALSETFEALSGFRPLEESRAELSALRASAGDDRAPFDAALAHTSLKELVAWVTGGGADVDRLVDLVSQLSDSSLVAKLATEYPGDPGIIVAMLLHHVTLQRGEALFLPAGNIHAYLSGLGVELMTASDNVLRGGLTPKHVDVPELLSVLDFSVAPVPYLRPTVVSETVEVFRPGVPDFQLVRFTGGGSWSLGGPGIVLCTSGSFEVSGGAVSGGAVSGGASGAASSAVMGAAVSGPFESGGAVSRLVVSRGDSVYVTPDEGELTVTGTGELFLATTD